MNKAIFYDRDGVVNVPITEGGGYVLHPDDFALEKGISEALKLTTERGYLNILITNQKCVAKELINDQQLQEIHQRMVELLAEESAHFDAIYACTDPLDAKQPAPRYKPNPAMILEAAQEYDIDLQSSWMVGDQDRDIEAAHRAGITQTIRIIHNQENRPTEQSNTHQLNSVSDLPKLLKEIIGSTL